MSVERKKLQTLQRAYELQEQRALEEKKRIDVVVDQRREALSELQEKDRLLKEKLQDLMSRQRFDALARGDSARLASLSRFEQSVREQGKVLSKELEERSEELKMALDRAAAAHEEVLAAKVERKKLERFLDSRDQLSRITNAAHDEINTEELDFFRRRK